MNTEEFLEHQKRIIIDAINETQNNQSIDGLRDYFAGLAMQAIITANGTFDYDEEPVSLHAYKMADAMLKERERRE